jgi:hypothetical protein
MTEARCDHWEGNCLMFNIIRFISEANDANALNELEAAYKNTPPGSFAHFTRRKDFLNIDVCDSMVWKEHLEKIEEFVLTFTTLIQQANRLNMDVLFDVAVHDSDIVNHNRLLVGLTAKLTRMLGDLNIEFRISIYNFGDKPDVVTPVGDKSPTLLN